MVSGYLSRQTNEWGLNILNGVHNHAMEQTLEGHMLSGRLKCWSIWQLGYQASGGVGE